LARRLVERDDHLWLSRSWTTRPVRPSEQGDEYFFVDADTFATAIKNDEFLEWAEFHGHLYGTPRPHAPAGADVLLEIEVQGAEQVRRVVPDAEVILVLPPTMERLEARLRHRGDDETHVRARLESAPDELAKGRALASHVVVNDEVERASDEILSILEERRSRRSPFEKD